MQVTRTQRAELVGLTKSCHRFHHQFPQNGLLLAGARDWQFSMFLDLNRTARPDHLSASVHHRGWRCDSLGRHTGM
jgi:hypothetical protein